MIPLIFITDCSQELQSLFWMGEGYMIFQSGNDWTMMLDQCPHLHIPLSTGWLEDGCVVCPWHQWKFDEKGDCVWPPPAHKEKIPVFSIAEKNGVLWRESSQSKERWCTVLLRKHWKDVEEEFAAIFEANPDRLLWIVIGVGEQTRLWCGGAESIDVLPKLEGYDWVEL